MATLYHVPLSPYCRKVRLSLAEKKIDCELIEERYWEQNPDFLRRNPAGKVPVLKIDGMVMAESAARYGTASTVVVPPQASNQVDQ